MKKTHALAALIPLAILSACGRNEVATEPTATTPPESATGMTTAPTTPGPDGTAQVPAPAAISLESRSGGTVKGELKVTTAAGAVLIDGQITGLTPGVEHGIHLHAIGDCSAPDATSAGDHFNPGNAPHGAPAVADRHLGDIPNITADTSGRATLAVSIPGATLRDGGPRDVAGKALVVHAQRDDYVTQPSGDSGPRIGCGVVR